MIQNSTVLRKFSFHSYEKTESIEPIISACSQSSSLESASFEGFLNQSKYIEVFEAMIPVAKIHSLELNGINRTQDAIQILRAVSKSESLVQVKCQMASQAINVLEFARAVNDAQNLCILDISIHSYELGIQEFESQTAVDEEKIFATKRSIQGIKFSCRNRSFLLENSAYIELDLQSLIFEARLLSGSRFVRKKKGMKQHRHLPAELIEAILLHAYYDEKVCSEDQLKTIIRCMLDRRTLGKIVMKEMEASKSFMYVRCRSVLESLR